MLEPFQKINIFVLSVKILVKTWTNLEKLVEDIPDNCNRRQSFDLSRYKNAQHKSPCTMYHNVFTNIL